jgi:hypothetical protein
MEIFLSISKAANWMRKPHPGKDLSGAGRRGQVKI